MKKRLYGIGIIFICFIIIGMFLCKQLTSTIVVKKYEIGELVSVDLDNDGKEEKIQVTASNDNGNPFSRSKKEIYANVDDNKYIFFTEAGESVTAFGIADLNLDNKFELLVRVCDFSISPSYHKWNIYKYDSGNLTFVKKISNGDITYNKLTNKLKVEYSLHETAKPMTETLFYDIDF